MEVGPGELVVYAVQQGVIVACGRGCPAGVVGESAPCRWCRTSRSLKLWRVCETEGRAVDHAVARASEGDWHRHRAAAAVTTAVATAPAPQRAHIGNTANQALGGPVQQMKNKKVSNNCIKSGMRFPQKLQYTFSSRVSGHG